MADNTNFKVPHRRRREQKTDYEQRLKLLKSDHPRAVVRTSNKHTKMHLSFYKEEGDENRCFTSTEELENFGWSHNTGNLPSAYLAGFLMGSKAEEDKAILDIGLQEKKSGGRVFAAVKGMIDAGLEIPAGEEAFPEEERISGEHIEQIRDVEISEELEEVKEEIRGEFE
ncbi:MAG: 50S ribosomal protein L18 [Candidatus Nanohaloarchaea archaeon]